MLPHEVSRSIFGCPKKDHLVLFQDFSLFSAQCDLWLAVRNYSLLLLYLIAICNAPPPPKKKSYPLYFKFLLPLTSRGEEICSSSIFEYLFFISFPLLSHLTTSRLTSLSLQPAYRTCVHRVDVSGQSETLLQQRFNHPQISFRFLTIFLLKWTLSAFMKGTTPI